MMAMFITALQFLKERSRELMQNIFLQIKGTYLLTGLMTSFLVSYITRVCPTKIKCRYPKPGVKTAPPHVDNLKLPRTFTEYTEWCYHLLDTCLERSTPRSKCKLKNSIFNIYTCFEVIFPHHYTCHSYLYISKDVIHHANT